MKTISKITSATLGFMALLFGGCSTNPENTIPDSVKTNKSSSTYVVTVGMETSRFAGSCPGAALDAQRMTALLRNYTDNVTAFESAAATKDAVKKAIKEGIAKAELFIFYYSGHGGSSHFYDTGAEEIDGKDEYYCLYDTQMRDNEMWEMIKDAKCRVLIINDCCHSQTLFKNPCGITFKRCVPLSVTHNEEGTINMQCWSGCPDDTYSYGSKTGGQFTNALLRHFDGRKTYDYLWTEIENDSLLKHYETVQRTIIGNGFVGKPVFQ